MILGLLWLGGCGAHVYHVVKPDDTLYSISFRYGQDYREVAEWNDLEPPYMIRRGQQVRVAPPRDWQPRATDRVDSAAAPAREQVAPRRPEPTRAAVTAPQLEWSWPVDRIHGRSDASYKPARRGLDFEARRGEPVRAAAAGRVVYGGAGIPHYGNLLIIKHNDQYLSAYAHNQRLLVNEGDEVRAGQQVAEMGDTGTGTDSVKLHFEIRLDGTPVDPMRYLPK